MKNLKPYDAEPIDFYRVAVAAKDSVDLQARLIGLDLEIKKSYNNYQAHFDNNTLENLVAEAAFRSRSVDLLSLYSYQSVNMRKLRREIELLQNRQLGPICQLCTLTGNESMDHFVPKEEFPEFAINPLNLVPCCLKCNQFKSNVWRKNGVKVALNLYTDELPDTQYLFVEIFNDEYGEMNFRFYLDGALMADEDLFELLYSHFVQLNLFSRIREKAIPVITELQNAVMVRLKNLSFNTIRDEVIETAELNKKVFGANYWKSIVEIALISSPQFRELIAP